MRSDYYGQIVAFSTMGNDFEDGMRGFCLPFWLFSLIIADSPFLRANYNRLSDRTDRRGNSENLAIIERYVDPSVPSHREIVEPDDHLHLLFDDYGCQSLYYGRTVVHVLLFSLEIIAEEIAPADDKYLVILYE